MTAWTTSIDAMSPEVTELAEKLWAASAKHVSRSLDGREVPENTHPHDVDLLAGDLAGRALLMHYVGMRGENPPKMGTVLDLIQIIAHVYGAALINAGLEHGPTLNGAFEAVLNNFLQRAVALREQADG
jgi:hypothetical protein